MVAGEWDNGLQHGIGISVHANGKSNFSRWNQGTNVPTTQAKNMDKKQHARYQQEVRYSVELVALWQKIGKW